MSMAIPRFITNKPGAAQKQFFQEFASLLSDTAYQALNSKTIHQILWDIKHHKIIVKKHIPDPTEKNKHKQFKTLAKDVFHTQLDIPTNFKIINFFINGNDEVKPGMIMDDFWLYVMQDGSCQPTTINLENHDETPLARFSITINPFYSQATLHDVFQKP